MKTFIATLITLAAVASIATSADARPRHKVCTTHHHHRVCHWAN
jgi:hypothetical protein